MSVSKDPDSRSEFCNPKGMCATRSLPDLGDRSKADRESKARFARDSSFNHLRPIVGTI